MSELATSASSAASNCAWYSKMSECLRRNRNRVEPALPAADGGGVDRQTGIEYFAVAPRRVLRVLRPELRSEKFYEPSARGGDRAESMLDNFYSRWARRPHPSGNCRCSFRDSSSRLSSHEGLMISRQINRIRTSLCEAERTGRDVVEELEKTLAVDLSSQLDEEAARTRDKDNGDASLKRAQLARIECLDECAKKRIVRDLDRYISELLDEILNDTIKAAIERERRDNNGASGVSSPPAAAAFDISFTFRNDGKDKEEDRTNGGDDGDDDDARLLSDKGGYVNRGFVGTANDPDTLDFCLNHRRHAAILDCVDSGINSVETVELQTSEEQEDEHNLEQSLMDIIDAKLGGSSIGKSLEDLGMEIDAEDATMAKSKESSESRTASEAIISEAELAAAAAAVATPQESEKSTILDDPAPVEQQQQQPRVSKSLDTIEEPAFNSLRLEFKRSSSGSTACALEDAKQQSTAGGTASYVSSKVNKTVSVIRRRLATRLAHPQRKPKKKNNSSSSSSSKKNKAKKKSEAVAGGATSSDSRPHSRASSTRASLELEDYRRRFPVPEATSRRHNGEAGQPGDDEVTLRNRKPTIVFLHGFGSSAESFQPQLSYFANLGYPCVAPDLLGHGFSSAPSRPKDYQFDKLLADLEALLLHYAFKPAQKCVLVAHNYGCSFAAALAYKYASNVHQLVLISGGGPTPLAPPPAEGAGHCCLRASLAPFLVCGMNRAVLYSARGRQHPYCGSEELEEQRPSHMRHVLKGMSWPDGDYVFHRRICTPTLLVHGLRDNKVSLVQECQMERTMIKAFLEAIPSAGHVPMTDCPEQLNHMIHCFIDLWKNKKW